MFDYFDQFQFQDRYCCGLDKRNAMRLGELRGSKSKRYAFKGDEDVPKTPLNAILAAMLLWFQARYVKLLPNDDDPDISDEMRKIHKRADVDDSHSEESAGSLDSHDALLKLLEAQLQRPWPKNDKVGDQLEMARSTHVQTIPAPNFNAEASDGDDDQGKNAEAGPAAKRARLNGDRKGKGRMVEQPAEEEESAEDLPAPRVVPVRTRGNRTRRGASSRTASAYNLRRTASRRT